MTTAGVETSARRRVVLCTYPGVYADIVLDEVLQAEHIELVGVVCSTRMLNKNYGALRGSFRQIQLSGLRYAAYLWVVTGLYTLLQGVFRKPTLLAHLRARHIPLLATTDINAAEALAFLRQLQPDVLLTAHFNQLISPAVLDVPAIAALNIHPSLLPAFKGVDPAFYTLLRHVSESGATLHLLDEQFDHGRILEQARLKIRGHDSLLSLNMKLFKLGALSAVRQVGIVQANTAGTEQQGRSQYDSWPNPQDTRLFRQQRHYFRWREYLAFVRRASRSDSRPL